MKMNTVKRLMRSSMLLLPLLSGAVSLAADAPADPLFLYRFQDSSNKPTLANTGTAGGNAVRTASEVYRTDPLSKAVTDTPPGGQGYAELFGPPLHNSGACLTLDNSSDKLRLKTAGDRMTIVLWLKWNGPETYDTAHGDQGLVTTMDNGNSTGWGLYLIDNSATQADTATLQFGLPGIGQQVTDSEGPLVHKGVWTQIAFVFETDTNRWAFYINGQPAVATGAASTSAIAKLNSNPIVVGQTNQGYLSLNGVIDDLRIYDKALTQAQIKALGARQEPATRPR